MTDNKNLEIIKQKNEEIQKLQAENKHLQDMIVWLKNDIAGRKGEA